MKPIDKSRVHQDACDWLAKLDTGELTARQHVELKKWMDASPLHRAEILTLARLWKDLNVLTSLAAVSEHSGGAVRTPQRSRRYFRPLAAAALLLLSLGLLMQSAERGASGYEVYITNVGEQRRVLLSDGTVMHLNTNSRAEIDYRAAQRIVYLASGEAHFDVFKDSSRPFVVHVGEATVTAVGTAFTVFRKSEGMDVTVTEGVIRLEMGGASPRRNDSSPETGSRAQPLNFPLDNPNAIMMTAGQRASGSRHIESVRTVAAEQLQSQQAWRDGKLRFSDESLEAVIDEMSRYTPLTIVIVDERLRHLRFGGVFNIGETEKLFAALQSGFGIHIEQADDRVSLSLADDSTY